MAQYTYDPMVALDQTGAPLRSGHGQIYARTDTTFSSPLAITGLSGEPLPSNEVDINDLGLTEAFIATEPHVFWKSGDFIVSLSSPEGMLEEAKAARLAAETAQFAAQQSAAAAATSAQAAQDAANAAGGTNTGSGVGGDYTMPVWNGVGTQPLRRYAANVPNLGGTAIPTWVHVTWRQPIAPTNGIAGDSWQAT